MITNTTTEETIKYSKLLSALFCSISIVALSILCLLNNLSLDIYSALFLLKIVIPASVCFWFSGFVIGKILDSYSLKIETNKIKEEEKAYEIPSMFSMDGSADIIDGNYENPPDDELGVL